jgi:hypothetical protein
MRLQRYAVRDRRAVPINPDVSAYPAFREIKLGCLHSTPDFAERSLGWFVVSLRRIENTAAIVLRQELLV